jgi:4-amino-4-deoxy-L-arabinose transferase-like glycosyltransferase
MRIARIDVPLTATVLAAVLAYYQGCIAAQSAQMARAQLWYLAAGLASGLAVLLKGPIGLALIVTACGSWWLLQRPRLPMLAIPIFLLSAAAVSLPWCLWANHLTDGEWFRVFILHHNLARYRGTSPLLASHPWWFYLVRGSVDLLPWSPLLVVSLIYAWRSGLWKQDHLWQLGMAGFAGILLLLSSAQFKRADYLLPAYPFAALAIGCTAQHWLRHHELRYQPRCPHAAVLVFHTAWIATALGWIVYIGWIEPRQHKQADYASFAAAIRQQAPAPHLILQFRMESHLLSFHLGMPVETLVEWHDLQRRLSETPRPHFVVMPREYVYPAMQILAQYHWLPRNHAPLDVDRRSAREYVFLQVE